jgi:hypothetical protein
MRRIVRRMGGFVASGEARGRLIAEVPYDTDDSMDASPYGAHVSHLGSRELLRDLIEFALS